MPNLQTNYSADGYPNPFAFEQTALELPVTLDLNTLIPEDDIARTVLMAVSESGVYRYVVNNSRDSHGFGCREMLKAVILANTQLGIASVRDMENLARNDIRYRLIFRNGETPSFMSFQRFIHDDLAVSVETIMTEVNKYMERVLPDDIDTKTEVIDGTKEEADFFTTILICTVELMKAEKSIMEMSWKGDVRKSPGVD
jgi:transposase